MQRQDAARNLRRAEPGESWGATLPEGVELVLAGPGAAMPASREVVFAAADLPDLARLLAGIGDGREVHVLDMSRGGLAQIAAVLDGRSNLSALHILGHGQAGTVVLGDLVLTQANLSEHAATLAAIGAAMAPDGDILLYGCDIGADAGLVQDLAIVTGADLAASNDLTGAAALGGDWELEIRVGDVTAAPVADAALAAQYRGVLALG